MIGYTGSPNLLSVPVPYLRGLLFRAWRYCGIAVVVLLILLNVRLHALC